MWTWNKTGEFSYPSLFHYYTNIKDNDIDFKSKVFLGHGHETNFFGDRFGPLLVYLLEK